MPVQVITMSTKGQIVIPNDMRESLCLEPGSKLAAFCEDGFIVLKPIAIPIEEDFRFSLDKAQKWAKSVGYKESDIKGLVKETRGK